MEREMVLAACGLDCTVCDIRLLPTDPAAAERTVAWYREMRWLKEGEGAAEALARQMYCCGCRGDRAVHWSPGCGILTCCVDQKGLDDCSQCEQFACERLLQWVVGYTHHAAALERLKEIRALRNAAPGVRAE